ncbi:MAG: calcium-binding protein [Solirubrobacterales bacterium]
MPELELGTLAAGEARTYRFVVTMLDGGPPSSPYVDDNLYQRASAGIGYEWTLSEIGGEEGEPEEPSPPVEPSPPSQPAAPSPASAPAEPSPPAESPPGAGPWHEKQIGTPHADRLIGSSEDDIVYARDGADWVFGRGGQDFLAGGAGADWLYGGAGDDRLRGGVGRDHIDGGARVRMWSSPDYSRGKRRRSSISNPRGLGARLDWRTSIKSSALRARGRGEAAPGRFGYGVANRPPALGRPHVQQLPRPVGAAAMEARLSARTARPGLLGGSVSHRQRRGLENRL